MRKKYYSLLAIFFLMFTIISPAFPSISASAEGGKVYADGEYELPFTILKADEDTASTTENYVHKPASLFVQDGEYKVQIKLKQSSWWNDFKVKYKGDYIDVQTVSEEQDERVVQFPIENPDEMVDAKVHIVVTGIPGFNYDNKYDIRFQFDTSKLPEVPVDDEPSTGDDDASSDEGKDGQDEQEEPEQPIQPEEPEQPEQPEHPVDDKEPASPIQPTEIELKDGHYTIEFQALHAEEDKNSAIERYLNNPTKLSVKDGKVFVTITINDHQTVTGFQLENNGKLIEPTDIKADESSNTREVTYELDKLLNFVKAQVQYKVGNYNGNQSLRLAFKEETLQKLETPADPRKEYAEYELPFEVWKEDADQPSVADTYFEKPGKLIVENGKYYVLATLKNSSWWEEFKVKYDGEYQDVETVEVNEAEDTRVVKFPVEDPEEIVYAKVHIIIKGIPGFTYDNKYNLRFKFDTSGLNDDAPAPVTVELNKKFAVKANTEVRVKDTNISIVTPSDLPEGTEMEIKVIEGTSLVPDKFEVAGPLIDVTLFYPDGKKNKENFLLTLPYDNEKYGKDEVDIYYLSETGWVAQNGTADSSTGTISVEVDHFSIYGVLADAGTTDDDLDNDEDQGGNDDNDKDGNNPNNGQDGKEHQNGNNNNNPNQNDDSNNQGIDENKDEQKVCKDGEYIIPVEILKANADEKSVANDYIKDNQGKLIVKDGKFKVQLIITNSSWWKYFKVATKDGYKDVRVISEDKEQDTRIVEFDVANPGEILPGKVHIIVIGIPGFEYDNEYDIRLKFDVSGVDLSDCIDESVHNPTGSIGDDEHVKQQDDNATEPKGTEDPLTFDRDGDGTSQHDKDEKSSELNPKTSDKTKIALFASLLVASLIPLLMKLRHKFRIAD